MNANGFRIQKQFDDNFALIGPDGLTWHTAHCAHQALKTQWSELQRAFEMGRTAERQWQKSTEARHEGTEVTATKAGAGTSHEGEHRRDAEGTENTEGK